MVVVAPRSDPVIVHTGDLQSHRRIMNTFGPGRNVSGEAGPHHPHRWFSVPKSPGLMEMLLGQGRQAGMGLSSIM